MMSQRLRLPLAVLAAASISLAVAAPGDERPWEFTDIHGKTHRPWEGKSPETEAKAVVLAFITTDCPISNYYHPTLNRLVKEYAKRGVRFYMMHVDPTITADEVKVHAEKFGITAPIILEGSRDEAKRWGAKHMPEVAVIGRGGKRHYLGRIDNTYVGFGKRRPKPTSHDLQAALDDVLAGRKVKTPRTEPIGCFISFE